MDKTLIEMAEEIDGLEDDGTLYLDGFKEALVGHVYQFNRRLAVYDYYLCVDVLMDRDGMDELDAIEYIEFNVTGAWVGDYTPVFIYGSLSRTGGGQDSPDCAKDNEED